MTTDTTASRASVLAIIAAQGYTLEALLEELEYLGEDSYAGEIMTQLSDAVCTTVRLAASALDIAARPG